MYYDVLDFNIGNEVTFHGKVFKVILVFNIHLEKLIDENGELLYSDNDIK